MRNLFLWCGSCLIKLKAAVSGQWPPLFADEAFRHFSLPGICGGRSRAGLKQTLVFVSDFLPNET